MKTTTITDKWAVVVAPSQKGCGTLYVLTLNGKTYGAPVGEAGLPAITQQAEVLNRAEEREVAAKRMTRAEAKKATWDRMPDLFPGQGYGGKPRRES